jgi:2-dehydro-3-deoxygluconokinase
MKLITFGEVMMRLSPQEFKRFAQADLFEVTYGGGEANVALALAQLGISSEHVTAFPDNEFGYAASAYFRKYGVSVDNISYKGKRIGVYFLEKGSSVRASKVVYDREHSAFAELNPADFNWEKILTGATWFHWTGITPAISQNATHALMEGIRVAKSMGLTVSGDITFRKNLWQWGKTVQEVMPGLVKGCDLIICGESEAEEVFGVKINESSANRYEEVARDIVKLYPNIKQVITTKRETINASHNKLGGLLFNGDRLLETKSFDIVPIVDRIGGGDAFAAGFIYASMKGMEDQKKIEFAVAASVLKHTIPGDANLTTVKEVEQLMQGESVGRLVR